MNVMTYLKLLMFPIFTGLTFHMAAYTVQYFSASGAAAWRFGVAAAVMVAVMAWRREIKREVLRQNGWMYLLLGLVGVLGFNLFFFLGMKGTSPMNGALIMATNPLVTALLARLLLKEEISPAKALGIGVSLLGVVLVITQGSWELIRTLSVSGGDLLILLGNICWALYGVLARKHVRSATPLLTTGSTMAVGAAGLIALAPLFPSPAPLTAVPAAAWAAILFMAVCTSVLGYLWWNESIAKLGASRTSVFFNLVPIVTLLTSVALGQTVTWVQALGTVLVLSGVLTASGLLSLRMRRPGAGGIME